jgi:bromodomain-containing factor 1
MDLGTVEQKLIVSDPRGPPKDKSKMKSWDPSKGSYGSVSEVVQDVRQIWENTRKFNGPDHLVTQQAKKLEEVFEKMVKNIPAEVSIINTDSDRY